MDAFCWRRPSLVIYVYQLTVLVLLLLCNVVVLSRQPFNVTYDNRAIVIDGRRRLLISAGIHYPRATPEMWPGLLRKAKDGGANVIQTYVFWNGHEQIKGKFDFSGRYDLPKFAKLVNDAGLYLHLRIGPYACAEWNFGGFPVWLRDIPGIVFRTNNTQFQTEMSTFVKKIVGLMRQKKLFAWQGGPIVLAQIENEYGDVEHSFGDGGREYVEWAATMAQNLDTGVPWVMCKQADAPTHIINACNGFYCDGFRPNALGKPALWTEDWNGWFTSWGDLIPTRPVEDNAFAVARFFQRGGSFHNYYMYYGGTNFGHTSGGPFVTTSYDYDAPIDEYGLLRQPKWGHLKELHAALMLCEESLFAKDADPLYVKLGRQQEAHIYGDFLYEEVSDGTSRNTGICAAFLANIDPLETAEVEFNGNVYHLPPWSVSILPDCKNVAFNTAKVNAQTGIFRMRRDHHRNHADHIDSDESGLLHLPETTHGKGDLSWNFFKEMACVWSNESFVTDSLLDHLNVTKDLTDYLWYIHRIEVSSDDIESEFQDTQDAILSIGVMRDAVSIFVNGNFVGSAAASTAETWVKVEEKIQLRAGQNEIALLSSTMGLQNYGAFLEKDGAGIQGSVTLTGLTSGDVNITIGEWVYQVGLRGESLEIFTDHRVGEVPWSPVGNDSQQSPITWYKTIFDAPTGEDPVGLYLGSMGKGEAWVNGRSLGRFWPAFKSNSTKCSDICDYRGTYTASKCLGGCGQPTQQWYHVPRSWLYPKDNRLVLFEEIGGDVSKVTLGIRFQDTVCSQVFESQPSLKPWLDGLPVSSIPELFIDCGEGNFIESVSFASFGNPYGRCGMFQEGHCHFSLSKSLVDEACTGHQNCAIEVNWERFGDDPCPGVLKSLAVEAMCANHNFYHKRTNSLAQ